MARHARAGRVEITIEKQARAVSLTIHNDGRSFQADRVLRAKNNNRLGLLGMRERVEMIGGRLAIHSAPGRGTTIYAKIPTTKPHRRLP